MHAIKEREANPCFTLNKEVNFSIILHQQYLLTSLLKMWQILSVTLLFGMALSAPHAQPSPAAAIEAQLQSYAVAREMQLPLSPQVCQFIPAFLQPSLCPGSNTEGKAT